MHLLSFLISASKSSFYYLKWAITVSYLAFEARYSLTEASSATEAAKNSYSFLSLKLVNRVLTLSNNDSSAAISAFLS